MKRILGLDLGTSSIGWAVVNQAESEDEQSSIVDLGVRVNPLTVDESQNFEKGKPITTTADRTLKRGMRRSLQRYKLRRDHLVAILKQHGFITDNDLLSECGNRSTFQTFRLRAIAATHEISLSELARVLLMINKKRGYKSNRKANKDNAEDGQLIDGMDVARKLYNEQITPGQYVYKYVVQKNRKFVPDFYPSDLRAELQLVWDKQSEFYPDKLTPEYRAKIEGKSRTDVGKTFFAVYGITAAEEKKRDLRNAFYYGLRARAVSECLPLEQVAAVIAAISGDIAGSSGYLGSISDHSKELVFGHCTVGQYLMAQLDKDPHYRVKNRVYYRQDYLNEFETIWETQARYHKELTPDLKAEIRDTVIFYQRRLKSKKGLVAVCELEGKRITVGSNGHERQLLTGPKVCPKSSPLFQDFKVWSTVNAVRVKGSGSRADGEALSDDQRKALHAELCYSPKLSKAEIMRVLGLNAKTHTVNYDSLQGNTTLSAIVDACRRILLMSGHDAEGFDKLDAAGKKSMIASVFGEVLHANHDFLDFDTSSHDAMLSCPLFKLWHLLYSYEDDHSESGIDSLVQHISSLTGLEQVYAKVLAGVSFVDDYGNLSSKAISRILPFLEQGFVYSEACEKAGYRHSKASITTEENDSRELLSRLELLPKNSLRNPVVEKILNQMIHVVNGCSDMYGRFDEIHVEMARELKRTKDQREADTKRIAARSAETEKIKELLIKEFHVPHPSRNDVIRYRLYQELKPNGYKTLYSNTYIPCEKLFTPRVQIEHIIPQSRYFDDSYANKTLETNDVNLAKGNMTALDYVTSLGAEAKAAYEKRIEFLNTKETAKKFKYLNMTESHIPDDFLNRDLSDSQYIARKAKEILGEITRVVTPTVGSITGRLREDWGLVDAMKDLNWSKYHKLGLTQEFEKGGGHTVRQIVDWSKRNDHRHHAMDALTIAFTRPQHIQFINGLNAHASGTLPKNLEGVGKVVFAGGKFKEPIPNMRQEALRFLEKILVSVKAKNKVATRNYNKVKCHGADKQLTLTPRQQLHNETVYGTHSRKAYQQEKVGSAFTAEKIASVADKAQRKALLQRLALFGGDPKKAFTGKNSLAKNPLLTAQGEPVPEKVMVAHREVLFTIRKAIDPTLKIDKVVDPVVRDVLKKRLDLFGGDAKKAFSNLDDNPIWLNQEAGIAIKRVKVKGVNVATPLHTMHDKDGRPVLDASGNAIPVDYVSTSGNHHVAIFEDADGNLQEHIVSYFEAMALINAGFNPVDKEYNRDKGWKFCFTMKRNEYFVFPGDGFNPAEVDLMDPSNRSRISPHLFRVQMLSTGYYMFRHHLETTVDENNKLRGVTWERIRTANQLKGIVKVRVNHNGRIVAVGEY